MMSVARERKGEAFWWCSVSLVGWWRGVERSGGRTWFGRFDGNR